MNTAIEEAQIELLTARIAQAKNAEPRDEELLANLRAELRERIMAFPDLP